MKFEIKHGMYCGVDADKDHCSQEGAHCYVALNGARIAQVNLNTLEIKGKELKHNERNLIYDFISDHRTELLEEYNRNRKP